MLKVILINGVSYAGKDTFVDYVENAIGEYNVGRMSTIDPIKTIYKEFFGWNEEKTPDARKNLNTLKNIWRETSNGPLNYVAENITMLQNTSTEFLFVMVREFDEMMSIKELAIKMGCECYTLKVIRDLTDIPVIETEFLQSHPQDFEYDITINNPTTETYPYLPEMYKGVYLFTKKTEFTGEFLG